MHPRIVIAALALTVSSGVSHGIELQGVVTSQQRPLGGVAVTVEDRESGGNDGPASITVFTDSKGAFRVHGLTNAVLPSLDVRAHKLGYAVRAVEFPAQQSGEATTVRISMDAVDNVADQVPASAWLTRLPLEHRGARYVAGMCAGCHQFPTRQVMRFAQGLAGLDEGTRQAKWEEVTSTESQRLKEKLWQGVVQSMRARTLYFSAESPPRWGLKEDHPEYQQLLTADFSLFSKEEELASAEALARWLTSDFSRFSLSEYPAAAAPLAVTPATTITEYALHTGGWTREVAWTPAHEGVFVLEDNADRIGRLDPSNGRVRWRRVEGTGEGPQGPHTINADREGNLWVSLEESYALGMLNPGTDEWKIYPGFGRFAVAHDTCIDHERYVVQDKSGKVWLTLIGQNRLASVDVKTGAIEKFPMPGPDNGNPFHTALYGCVMTSDRNQVWITQLNGIVGGFDIGTGRLVAQLDMPLGAIPHRPAIDDKDILYVPLSGDGQVLAYDTRNLKELTRYALPDRNASAYSATWDQRRGVLWIAASNTDVIYRLDPKTGIVATLPLPRQRAFLRAIDLDRRTGDLWTTYAHLPIDRGPNFVVRIHPGD